ELIEPQHLPVQFATQVRQAAVPEASTDEPRTLAEVERAYIAQIMQRVESNKSKAAKILGISRQTLRKKLMEERGPISLSPPVISGPLRVRWARASPTH